MPLVRRKSEVEIETSASKTHVVHTIYVRPSKVQKGDEVITPTRRQLAELAEQYPEEFAAAADEAGVTAADKTNTDAVVIELMALPTKELIKAIADMDAEKNEAVLWAIHEAERDLEKPRKTVLSVLAQKGIAEGDDADDEDEQE